MNMIEKVAQAIADNIAAALPAGVEIDTRYAAIAAIEAMRDPTKEMWNAGTQAIEEKRDYSRDTEHEYECTNPSDQAVPCWQAMIDSALKESEAASPIHNDAPFSNPMLNDRYRVDEAGVIWDRRTGENISERLARKED